MPAKVCLGGGSTRGVVALTRQDQDASVGVLEKEAEFVLLVERIQRRGGAGPCGGEQRHDHRQTVGQRDADAIAAIDAGGGELFRHGLDVRAQRRVRDPNVPLRKNERDLPARTVFQQLE